MSKQLTKEEEYAITVFNKVIGETSLVIKTDKASFVDEFISEIKRARKLNRV